MAGRGQTYAALLALLFAFPGGARAATQVEPRFQASVEGRYDDDALLRTGDGEAPLAGELLTKVSAQAGVHARSRTSEAEAWYAPDLQLRYFSSTARLDHRAGVDLNHRLTSRARFTAELRGWRVSDPTSLPRTGMGRSLSPVLYGTAEGAVTSQLTRRVEGRLRYRFEGTRMLELDAPPGAVHAPAAELWLDATPRTAVGVEYRFQYFLYGPERAAAHAPVAALRHRLGRYTTLLVRGGPVFYQDAGGTQDGVAPRAHAEVARAFDRFELGVQAGQDLLGATGFASAVWAQYAGLYVGAHVGQKLRVFGGAYGFRNGPAPGTAAAWLSTSGDAAMTGYALGGGLEWSLTRQLLVQGQVDRIAQVGSYGPDVDLSRNIVAIRLLARTW